MMFLGHLLTASLQYIITIAVSCVGGIYVGKVLRDKKTAKQKKDQKQPRTDSWHYREQEWLIYKPASDNFMSGFLKEKIKKQNVGGNQFETI